MSTKSSSSARPWLRRIFLEMLFWLISLLVFVVTRGTWSVWRRNSLALGYWSEGSDLDITLFSLRNAPCPSALRILWKLFRPFGEWAAYSNSDHIWAHLANPLELARDPKLTRIFQPGRTPTRPESFVFWIRMADSDPHLQNFSKSSTRARKWEFHRQAIERTTGVSAKLAFPEYVEELANLLAPIPRVEWSEREALLKPHRWLGKALSEGRAIQGLFSNQPVPLLDVARSQVSWEIWGLLGQVRLQGNIPQIQRHLENLANLFPSNDPIRAAEAEFEIYLKNISQPNR